MDVHRNSFGMLILAAALMLSQMAYAADTVTVQLASPTRPLLKRSPAKVSRPTSKELKLPTTFELRQNYPNPFNASTTIEYTLPIEAGVFIAIYDIFFNRVKTIKNQTSYPGHYEVHWDGRDDRGNGLASGLYFYLFAANDNYLVGKMMLVK